MINVCITGGLRRYSRRKAFDLIAAAGMCPQSKMNRNTNILVIADDCSGATFKCSRFHELKAAGYEIVAINEIQFYDLLNAGK